MLRLAFALVAVCAASVIVAPAAAQRSRAPAPEQTAADQEARALFDAGSLAFSQGRYENALAHFRQAYELSARPQLLFNIAAAAERLRRDEEALEALRQFLVELPDSEQRAAVEARIAILEDAVREREAARSLDQSTESDAAPSTTAPSAQAQPAAQQDSTGPLALIISGGALAVVGGVLIGLAAADSAAVEQAEQGARWSTVSDAYARIEPLAISGGVAAGVGVATAAAGLVWLVLPAGDEETATVAIAPALGGVQVGGTF